MGFLYRYTTEGYCKANIDNIRQGLLLISIVRKLEQVGDHITNIAEEIIFYKEAKILKHGNKDELESEYAIRPIMISARFERTHTLPHGI